MYNFATYQVPALADMSDPYTVRQQEQVDCCILRQKGRPIASVITSKAANRYQFKTGQRKWPSRTEIVLPCRLLWWQVGFGAPAPRAALEHVPVV